MENLIDSSERTLVIFDAVCGGLSGCLSLVHSDIKHMTEHRNRLALLEQYKIQAKLLEPHELASPTYQNNHDTKSPNRNCQMKTIASDSRNAKHYTNHNQLVGLEILDKRLAETFSQVFNLNDQHKSSILAKEQEQLQSSHSKPNIFQVLLGKSLSSKSLNLNSNRDQTKKCDEPPSEGHTSHMEDQSELDNKLVIDDINRQIRLAMQYAKQLEAQLLKIEDLRSRYEMHLKMGLVVRNVSRAHLSSCDKSASTGSSPRTLSRNYYGLNDSSSMSTQSSVSSLNLSTSWSSSRSKQAAQRRVSVSNTSNDNRNSIKHSNMAKSQENLHSSLKRSFNRMRLGDNNSATQPKNGTKSTIREFIENIDKIEAEFESYMGSFLFAIEDIQGFARVCPGDVFEIGIKYGESEKFKTKVSVLKDERQKCDNRQAVFKARIVDRLAIKAYECKGLGKRVLLGHKSCETRDLFTARSQLMTISLNHTGSIKLNLVVTWNPLHLAPNNAAMDISHLRIV